MVSMGGKGSSRFAELPQPCRKVRMSMLDISGTSAQDGWRVRLQARGEHQWRLRRQ